MDIEKKDIYVITCNSEEFELIKDAIMKIRRNAVNNATEQLADSILYDMNEFEEENA